ncbi:hypothetical protein EP47_04095 [Legionella norrlandica]|uniref:MFS transporter n=1 Tax=Legionella norrlandica TaxID=1498499 RepID=A0A0A2SU06_9GAMM|nr:MFS transporter [Legionella norrlandica]KGP64242.1 hypothetical protein EP47_04095 [Legionella norrlandica]
MFITFFYIGGLLVSILYGSAYLLTAYMRILSGGELNMGNFMLLMGIGTLTSVGYLNRKLLRYFSALGNTIIGTACYSVGLVLLGMVHNVSYTYTIAILMGLGWGLIYTASIMALNTNISVARRKHHYSYYAATNALGAGMAPVIFHFLESYGIGLLQFYFSAGLYAGFIAVFCFIIAENFARREQAQHHQYILPTQKTRLGVIERNAVFMAFLSACIFSTLTFFQISFAEIYHLNYAIFFALITLALILSRLALAHLISVYNNTLFYLSLMMLGSIIMFLFIDTHFSIYIISAILFGISYGLVFPLIQTLAVAYSHESLHPSIITKFVFAYFIGIFCFPIAGASILVYLDPRMILILLAMLALTYSAIATKTLRMARASLIIG